MRGSFYIVVALAAAAIFFLIYFFDGNQVIVSLINDLGSTASRSGLPRGIVNFVTAPLTFALSSPVGAIIGGLMWPLAAVWLLLLMAVMIYAVVAPTFMTFSV